MKKRKKQPIAPSPVVRKDTTPPRPVAEAVAADPAAPVGAEASFLACRAEAEALDARDVKTFTGNPMVVYHNACRGAEAVLAERARIESDPKAPKVDFARVASTVRVAEALVFAAGRADAAVDAKSDLADKTADAYELRDLLLANAVGLAKAGVLDPAEVAKIQEGTGALDMARDCIALSSLYTRNADDIGGRTPVTAAQIRKAAELGTELLGLIKPAGVDRGAARPAASAAAAELRDRMALLLARRHEYVARVAGWLWGLAVAEHVPPLRSRAKSSPARPDEPPPDPKPDPA